jgi:peptide/nickel transport system ATP-binding protein
MNDDVLLKIDNLTVSFGHGSGRTEVVSNASFEIPRGEIVALVGESGSGKTVTALSITRLLPVQAALTGRILYRGDDLLVMPENRLRKLRGQRIAYVFQEPATALNPVFSAGYQIAEALKLHRSGHHADHIADLLQSVGIRDPERVAAAYPHQLSGGQQQRIMIAMALACEPDLLIADEPTTALDVTVQAQILELLQTIQAQRRMAVLLITHNLAVATQMAQHVVVMYAGHVVETGPVRSVVGQPRHPYTKALLNAVPRLRQANQPLRGIPGQIPAASHLPAGCRFNPRCAMVHERCRTEVPLLIESGEQRLSRCWYWPEVKS